MKTESVTSKPVASGGHIQQAGWVVFLLFIISVSSVGEAWALPLSFTGEQVLLNFHRQQLSVVPATTPESGSCPQFNLPPDASSVTNTEQFPSFDTTVVADGDSEFSDDALPRLGGPVTLTTGVLLAQLQPNF
jgi:hypothetical protein